MNRSPSHLAFEYPGSARAGPRHWVFTGGTHGEAETPILWPPDAKSWLIWNDPDAGKEWGQEEKGMTEDEMVGWHHWFNGHGFGWTPGDCDGQGGLACCGSWKHKELDTTEWLNLTELGVERPCYTMEYCSWAFCYLKALELCLLVYVFFLRVSHVCVCVCVCVFIYLILGVWLLMCSRVGIMLSPAALWISDVHQW